MGVVPRALSTLVFETRCLIGPKSSHRLSRLASPGILLSPPLTLLCGACKHMPPCLAFLCGFWGLNLGLHACKAGAFSTEPSSQARNSLFFFFFSRLFGIIYSALFPVVASMLSIVPNPVPGCSEVRTSHSSSSERHGIHSVDAPLITQLPCE